MKIDFLVFYVVDWVLRVTPVLLSSYNGTFIHLDFN